MVVFANPPQPIPTARRNAVTYQDRVSMLLNGAGSAKQNPIQSKNPSGLDSTGANGHAFRLSFSMADSSETVVSAVAALAGDSGERTSAWSSFKHMITRDLTSYIFNASLVIGEHFPSIIIPSIQDGPAQLVLVSIRTSLGRAIHQQVWVAREPSDMVLFNGIVTTEAAPLLFEMPDIDSGGNFDATWSVQFFPTWNDEIARQHGASTVALQSNIVKPYGGAKTVEIRRTTIDGALYLSETPIEQVRSMTWSPTADNETQKFIFIFRSELGSTHYLSKAAWVKFFTCEVGGVPTDASNNPPEIEPPAGGLEFEFGTSIVVDVVGRGDVVGGTGENSTVDIVLTGYKGGYSDLGTGGIVFLPVAGIASGTKTVNTASLGEQAIDISTGDIAEADMIVVEVQNAANTQVGNSLVYVRSDIVDYGDYPKVPQVAISPAPTFNFTTRQVTFTLSENDFPTGPIACRATPLWGAMSNPSGAPQTIANAFSYAGVEKTAPSISDVTSGVKVATFPAWTEAGTPDAVMVKISNNYGMNHFTGAFFFQNGSPTDSGVVKKGATIDAQELATISNMNDAAKFEITDNGDQVGTFTLRYRIIDTNMNTVEDFVEGVSENESTVTVELNGGHDDIDGYYMIWLEGEQGQSNVLTIDNLGGANTLGV